MILRRKVANAVAILALVRCAAGQDNGIASFHEGVLRCCICTYITNELVARLEASSRRNCTVDALESICAPTRRPFGTRCKKIAGSLHRVIDGEALTERVATEMCWRTEHCRRRREPYRPARVQLAKPGIHDHLLSIVTSGDIYGASAPPNRTQATRRMHGQHWNELAHSLNAADAAERRRLQVGPGSGQRPSHPRIVAEASGVPNIVHFIFGLQRVRHFSPVVAAPTRPALYTLQDSFSMIRPPAAS